MVTLTGSLLDAGQGVLDPKRTRVRIESNASTLGAFDTAGDLHLGGKDTSVAADGSFAFTDLVSTADIDGLAYQVLVNYPTVLGKGRADWSSGWFPLTADTTLAAVASIATPQAVPITTLEASIDTAADNVRANTLTAATSAQDAATAAATSKTNAAGSATAAATSATNAATSASHAADSAAAAAASAAPATSLIRSTVSSDISTDGTDIATQLDARIAGVGKTQFAGVRAVASPTGNAATDTSNAKAACAALLPGEWLWFQAGAYNLTEQLTIPATAIGAVVTGPGVLSWSSFTTPASGDCGGLLVLAPQAQVMSLTLKAAVATPNSGVNWWGILAEANDFRATFNTLDGWTNGIGVYHHNASDGSEIRASLIGWNRIRDLIGTGGGASGTESDTDMPEQRGDGIVTWGSLSTIIGNVVNAKAGTDARVGIHAESLDTYHTGPAGPHDDAQVTITGNVVYGQFRRSIASELVDRASITGNAVADATWHSINIARGKEINVSDNTIHWTRTASDLQGQAWNPTRAPLVAYGATISGQIKGNTITIAATGDAKAIMVAKAVSTDDIPQGVVFENNTVRLEAGAVVESMFFGDGGSDRLVIRNNQHEGDPFTDHGIYTYNCNDITIVGNRAKGPGTSTSKHGVHLEGAINGTTKVCDNTIDAFQTGLSLPNATNGGLVSNNIVRDCTYAAEFFGSSGFGVFGNMWQRCTNQIANPGTNAAANNVTLAS